MKINIKFEIELEFQEKVFFWKLSKSSSLIKGKLSFWLEGKNVKASFEKY